MNILLDITRTLARRYNSTPTGIDRVEHALARWLCYEGAATYPDANFVVTTPYQHALLSRTDMRNILSEIERRWAAVNEISRAAELYTELCHSLESPIALDNTLRGASRFSGQQTKRGTALAYAQIARLCILRASSFRKVLKEAERVPTLYLHSSHTQLEQPRLFDWTKKADKVRAAFFIHDIIPIDFPEFCGDLSEKLHKLRMKTVSEYGSSIVVNSAYTRERLISYFDEASLSPRLTDISHLGNVIQEYNSDRLNSPKASIPYFICLSTIEGRKNILHILNVWRQIHYKHGPERTPRLVIIGKRGWKSENVIDVLNRTKELAPYVVEVSGLKDLELASLMAGSAGILSPSLVEGYSLPPIEGAARHLPVVASDIAVHREILGKSAIFLDPTDGPGWRDAIVRLAYDQAFRSARISATYDLCRISWEDFASDTIAKAISGSGLSHL